MTIHPDQRYIIGLLNNDNQVIDEIYRLCSGRISTMIQQMRGSEADAADIFQESLVDIYNQARERGLELTCPFTAFVGMVCRRKWLNVLKKRGVNPVTKSTDDLYDYGEDVFAAAEQVGLREDRMRVFMEQFERLGEKCREILRLFLTGDRQEKIAESLGVTYGYLRKKKSECMATLLTYVQAQRI